MNKIETINTNVLSIDTRGKYHPAVGALGTECSEISYDKEDYGGKEGSIKRYQELGWKIIHFIENKETDTQCYIVSNDTAISINFRGTENDPDWANNFKFHKEDPRLTYCKNRKEKRELKKQIKEQLKKDNKTTNLGKKKGRAHQGHYKCMISVADQIIDYIKTIPQWQSKDIYVWGHSLGGALVGHFFGYADHILNFEMAYAIASSLFGNRRYVKFLKKQAKGRLVVIERNLDIVCKVPLHVMGYRRFHKYIYINAWDKLEYGGTFFLLRVFDLLMGLIQAPFSKKKGPVDDHHPAYYYNPQAKAIGCNKRLEVWNEYKNK